MVPSDKYSCSIYGHVKNTNNGAAITLLQYFTSASTTSGKYCCLLYGTFNKIYILHRPPPILLPSAMVPSENIVINGAFITRGKYYSLLLGHLWKKIHTSPSAVYTIAFFYGNCGKI
jgi:hypothetical protein